MSRLAHIGLEDPGLVGEHDGLDAVAKIQLLEDVRDVRLDGGLADEELFSDLGVRHASRHQAKDVAFSLTEIGEFLRRGQTGKVGELPDHALRDRRREKRLAGGNGSNGRDQLLG
jgi:hypothetical protein